MDHNSIARSTKKKKAYLFLHQAAHFLCIHPNVIPYRACSFVVGEPFRASPKVWGGSAWNYEQCGIRFAATIGLILMVAKWLQFLVERQQQLLIPAAQDE